MKSVILPYVFLCASAFAANIAVPCLSLPEHLDTEVSTNIVFSLSEKPDMFTVELSLNATPTNNVQISFGHDAFRGNGKLSSPEAELTVGWDCGKWFLRSHDVLTRFESAPAGTNLFRTVSLSLALRSDGTVREATVREGASRLFADAPVIFPSATSWNLLEAVARGIGVRGETFSVAHTIYGTRLILR